jgi:hypothetical protein
MPKPVIAAINPTAAYAEIKKALALGAVSPLSTVLAAEGAAQGRLGRTKDHAGAVEAFRAKRRPTFEGILPAPDRPSAGLRCWLRDHPGAV